MMHARLSNLPAAVIDPRIHTGVLVDAAARVVPEHAKRISLGKAQLGYRHRPGSGGRPWRFGARRLHEVERLIRLRHAGPVDTDDGEIYLPIAVHLLVPIATERAIHRREPMATVRRAVADWAHRWLPKVDGAKVDKAVDLAVATPRTWRADTAARMLRITLAERTAADIRTMGAIDADKIRRQFLSKQRHAERQRAARAAAREEAGGQTREEYEAGSVAAECRRLGISRSTYYRRLREAKASGSPAPEKACDRYRAARKKSPSLVAHATCFTSLSVPASRTRLGRAVTPVIVGIGERPRGVSVSLVSLALLNLINGNQLRWGFRREGAPEACAMHVPGGNDDE